MLTHKGFSAWITVAGSPLPEYLVGQDATGNSVNCWIPAVQGQNFSVHWKDHGGKVDTASFIYLDGLAVPGRFLFGEGEASRSGVRSSPTSERPFVFQELAEDSSNPSGQESGIVLLKIKRITKVGGRPANPLQNIPQGTVGRGRAGEMRIGFGVDQPTNPQYPHTWSVLPYEKDSTSNTKTPSTYVSFVFRYRSAEWLQSQSIMPKGDTIPPPLPADTRRASVQSTPMTPRESPDPPESTPPYKKLRSEKPGLQGKTSSPTGRARRPSGDRRRTASYQTPASRQASMEHVFHFPLLKEEVDNDPDWKP
ncbi:hypothetical protein MIND_01017000 [Mycena indigotica]|uniref:DUF7918 domain-containing protein n=1 Tax=Mycena indigotica TaxID=2126181 RepID=A0A8H6S8G3_9AGAR|nr:uncharacterized protein MIND_01017000 [Mycena indigotica]KAF7294793.1 hypothetical protein MIND_01017000 [Mycena indigotica]